MLTCDTQPLNNWGSRHANYSGLSIVRKAVSSSRRIGWQTSKVSLLCFTSLGANGRGGRSGWGPNLGDSGSSGSAAAAAVSTRCTGLGGLAGSVGRRCFGGRGGRQSVPQ